VVALARDYLPRKEAKRADKEAKRADREARRANGENGSADGPQTPSVAGEPG